MSVHTDIQIITQDGKPAFAVVPYDVWQEVSGQHRADDSVYIPHDVVSLQIKKGLSLIAAWRKYKGLSQKALASRIGISQPAMAQIESIDSTPQTKTLEKIASALGISLAQIIDD